MMSPHIGRFVIGYPRIGRKRELKQALESFWSGEGGTERLASCAVELRARHWREQAEAGLDRVCVNDFSYYDGMLDTCIMLGLVPERFRHLSGLDRYFAMARGADGAPAMRMRKWFNTNYHYIVPEIGSSAFASRLEPDTSKLRSELAECLGLGYTPKLSLIGPLTFLRLSESESGVDPLNYLPELSEGYKNIIKTAVETAPGVLIQFEEPVLAADPDQSLTAALESWYRSILAAFPNADIALATYFEHVSESLPILASLPLKALALDFVHGKKNLAALESLREWKCGTLFAGVVNGRGVWANDIDASVDLIRRLQDALKGRGDVAVSSSCSLLHVPYSAADETELPEQLRKRLAFASEKLAEIGKIAEALEAGVRSGTGTARPDRVEKSDEYVKPRLPRRSPEASVREARQRERLRLPPLPTTTIGSFPQTKELRELRASFKRGSIDRTAYEESIRRLIADCVRLQEELGLDVLVHGEFERTDMVEYFGENLDGFAFTKSCWVQSYGSRCVKPPIIYADVVRRRPITVDTIKFAQGLTEKPLKAMLTGPVTILAWSFVREDIRASEVCMQIARRSGRRYSTSKPQGWRSFRSMKPHSRRPIPCGNRQASFRGYAVDAFRFATGGVRAETQIHSHMCYSDFTDIMEAIEALDADVLSIESARGGTGILKAFSRSGYSRMLGPGVYDIHSPRVPSRDEILDAIRERIRAIGAEKLWVNPDCGLKTRGLVETEAALRNMVDAARDARKELR
jgi:5-methyltetrahydropteroyltriglutamate--homocysteine methyltransferase